MRHLRWVSLIMLGVACENSSGPTATLDVAPNVVLLLRNDTVRLTVHALDGEGRLVTGVVVTFESVDTSIARVDSVGLVRAGTALGQTTIFVSGGGTFREVPVRVIAGPPVLHVTPNDTTVRTHATVQYRVTAVAGTDTIPNLPIAWESNDTSLFTITSTGRATANAKVGAAFVIARYRHFAGLAVFRVATPGVGIIIAVTPADTAIPSGESVQLRATIRDAFGDSVAGAITWTSISPSLLSVSSTGVVQSLGPAGVGHVRASAHSDTLSNMTPVTVLDTILSARTKVSLGPYAAAISVVDAAYVSQTQNSRIVRLNLSSRAVTDTVLVGATPTELAFNSTGTRLYVTNQYSSTVSVINVATNSVIDEIPIGHRPFELIVEPGDSILWVAKIDSLYGVRLASRQIIARFQIGAVGNGVAIRHDTLLYVSTHSTGSVVEINLRTRSLGRTFTVGGVPQKLVVSPDGAELYIANEAGYLQFWDLETGLQIGSNLTLPSSAYGLAHRPSNGLLYATSAYFGGGYIYIIDPVTRTVVYSTIVGGATRDVVFTADGSTGIVANEGGWVDFIK